MVNTSVGCGCVNATAAPNDRVEEIEGGRLDEV